MKKRKTYEVSVIDKTYSKVIADETKFYTSDTALELGFELKETEYNFESAEIVLLNIDDRSLVTRPGTKVLDSFAYELDDDITAHYGEWRGQLRFEQAGEIYVSSPVKFRIENDLGNERPPQLSDVQSWVSLKRYADSLTEELKQAVLIVEGMDDTFNTNELVRQNQFKTAEQSRQTTFETNESERQSAELGRVEAEKVRAAGYQEVRNVIDNFEIGENAVGAENVKDGAITLDKVSFSKISSKNMFDLESIETGMLNEDGSVFDYGLDYFTSDFMKFNPGNVVKSNLNLQSSAIYDSNKKIISSKINIGHTQFTMPQNGVYVRVTRPTNEYIKDLMIYTGNTPTSYEPFKRAIDGEYIIDVDGETLKDKSLSIDKLNFVVQGKNLFNPTEVYEGMYVDPTSAILLSNPSYNTTYKKEVLPGEQYTITKPRFIVFFDENGNHLPEHSINTGTPPETYTITIQSNAYAYQYSYPSSYTEIQIEKGDTATAYESFGYYLDGVNVRSDNTTLDVGINLPKKIYGVVGKYLPIYFKNIIDVKTTGLDFDVSSSIGKQMESKWEYTPTSAGTTALSFSVYKDYQQIAKKDTNIVVADIAAKDLTVLYFGDSTVNAGGVTKRLLELYSEEASNLTLLGTRGLDTSNRFEGRGGWGAATYRTPTEIYGAGNPFYNPDKSDFDFNYYMTNQGYTTPNHFIIQLGINDVFGYSNDKELNTNIDKILSDFDFIISNVKSYNASIKIGVTVTIPPNDSQDVFGTYYGNGQTQWRYKRNNAIWASRLIEHFKDKETQGIYLVPMQHNIDTETNIVDAVHPTWAGYDQMGDSVYAYLKNIG